MIHAGDDVSELAALLVFESTQIPEMEIPENIQVIHVPEIEGWSLKSPGSLSRSPILRAFVSRLLHGLKDAYFGSKLVRVVFDGLGMPKLITQSSVFYLPDQESQNALLAEIPEDIYPRVKAADPVLVEIWKRGDQRQIHLVNYAADVQQVTIFFGEDAQGRRISPDDDGQDFSGSKITIDLNIYQVLLLDDTE